MSDWSVVSTCPNWTGAEVWLIGIVPPDFSFGASGVPGWRSTKTLPSRKMRGRIFSWASLWSGRPDLLISIVTARRAAAARQARHRVDLAHVHAGDPHGRLRLQVVRVLEDRGEPVRVGERVGPA